MSLVDLDSAYAACLDAYNKAYAAFMGGGSSSPIKGLDGSLQKAFDRVFASTTQSYREALLGCAIAKVCTPSVDVRFPYLKQGEKAFSGRTLDEKVINRFLRTHQVPCSKGAYLATFRRNVSFTKDTAGGLRDKEGFEGMLEIIEAINGSPSPEAAEYIAECIMYCFIVLRDQSEIKLMQSPRVNVYDAAVFITLLLGYKSGGLIPMLIVEAFCHTLIKAYGYDWNLDVQGINDADSATHALGDITITRRNGKRTGLEITERPIDEARVRDTYITKIALDAQATDYIFIYSSKRPSDNVYSLSKLYFQQGCNVSFVNIKELIIPFLIVGGSDVMTIFFSTLRHLFETKAPANVKAAWNDSVEQIIA